MGVQSLWPILEAAQTIVQLSSLSDQTIAVDLSAWICQISTSPVKNHYLRNLFFRTAEFLKAGVKLVFVIDGTAPDVKLTTLKKRQCSSGCNNYKESYVNPNRPWLGRKSRLCCELLDCLGVPWVQSPGEAEATCAQLSMQGIVDACITQDSDAFLYGARHIYRNYKKEGENDIPLESYTMNDIEELIGLDREAFIVMALLIGCDYDLNGVKGIGPERAKQLINEMSKTCPGVNILDRLCSWRHNAELIRLEEMRKNLNSSKQHCSYCKHLGTLATHRKSGCEICQTTENCMNSESSEDNSCPCDYHKQLREITPYTIELEVRCKAICNPGFPDEAVIQEFHHPKMAPLELGESFAMKIPDIPRLVQFLRDNVEFQPAITVPRHIVPLLVTLSLKCLSVKQKNAIHVVPLRICCTKKHMHKQCYEVQWKKLDCDIWTPGDFYTVLANKEMFSQCYPEMSEEYEKQQEEIKLQKKLSGRKRKTPECQLTKIDSIFKSKKKLDFTDNVCTSSGDCDEELILLDSS